MRTWLGIVLSSLIATSALAAGQQNTQLMDGSVARTAFTTGIDNREPMDNIGDALGNDSGEITYFTDLRNLAGQTVTHRWQYNGETMAEIGFNVGGDRWRVWSSKRLTSTWLGNWTVSVVNGDGQTLAEDTFVYQDSSM